MRTPEFGQPSAKGAEDSPRSQSDPMLIENDLSHTVIGAAIEVQRVLGTGLLESAYAAALALELTERGLQFEREWPLHAHYKGHPLGVAYRADFIVQDRVLLELKAQDAVTAADRAQLLSYLRLSGCKLGLLINFHTFPLGQGVSRVINQP